MKNLHLISSNLREAKEEIESILSNISSLEKYDEEEFKVALEHAYHHLNFSWNIRNADEERVIRCSEKDFEEWSKYPF